MGGRPEPPSMVFATTATALGVGCWPLMYKPGTNRATIFWLCAKYLVFISRPFTNQRDGTDTLLFFPSKIYAATISPSGFMIIFRPHPDWSHLVPGIWSETSQTKRREKRTNRRDTGNRDLLLESARRDVPGTQQPAQHGVKPPGMFTAYQRPHTSGDENCFGQALSFDIAILELDQTAVVRITEQMRQPSLRLSSQ